MADTTFLGKLRNSVFVSVRNLSRFRANRVRFIDIYAGPPYSPEAANTSQSPTPLNLIQSMVRVYTYLLVSNDPSVSVNAENQEMKPVARLLRLMLKDQIKRMKFGESVIYPCVLDSFFGQGIAKVGLESNSKPGVTTGGLMGTRPFAARVDLDNWVQDTTAATREQMQFIGDAYRVPLEEARNDLRFDKEMREKLTVQPYRIVDNF